ncbi:MAG TPA: pantoate--beta-alanine ligase [Gaiellaceae bacterium]
MKVVRTVAELRDGLPSSGTVGLVPTMGALHAGHVALVETARAECDFVVMSLFVNEAQFDSDADFARYPRNEERDLSVAEDAGVDIVFAPEADELFPPGYGTWVEPEEHGLEAEFRPGHFRGVATVCLKLFNIVRPQRVYFGQKDAQQVHVVLRMLRDFNHDTELKVVPTVRDQDGLALSSRNALLSPEERERARALPRALETGDVSRARELLDGLDVDYVAIADFEPKVLVAAVRLGPTRLIDNIPLEGEPT